MSKLSASALANSASYTTFGGLGNNGSISSALSDLTASDVVYTQIQGDIVSRFRGYAKYVELWSDPSKYQPKLIENGNNITKVIYPTKEDFFLAIEHGCRPEFIDNKLITLEEVQEFIDSKPHKFI